MRHARSLAAPAVILGLSLICLALGGWTSGPHGFAGFAGLGYVLARVTYWQRPAGQKPPDRQPEPSEPSCRPAQPRRRSPSADPNDRNALIDEMLAQGRFALLLRPQIAGDLAERQFRQALTALDTGMALVPEGAVVLTSNVFETDADEEPMDALPDRQRVLQVSPLFLDRYPVTNSQFYEFVAAGGYEQVSLWDASIWTAVLDMRDRTGKPGPRYWMDGVYLEGEEDHPVVGITWYEAAAYARWIGKRLPTDAEWVKAGAWPLPDAAAAHGQRRYPWGDSMDRNKANLWGSGPERIVSVHEFAEGVSVGGVHQLIGNTWEWTSSPYRGLDTPDGRLAPAEPMKSIRGGAFDTYFDLQATCQFQSGESPLRRKHNIGFRCAVGLCDLVFTRPAAAADRTASDRSAPVAEAASVPSISAQPAGETHV